MLISILEDDLDKCIRLAAEDGENVESNTSLIVAACCDFMAEATFTVLNEPPQTSIERLNELIEALRNELRDFRPGGSFP